MRCNFVGNASSIEIVKFVGRSMEIENDDDINSQIKSFSFY